MGKDRAKKSLLNLIIIMVMILSSWGYSQDQKKIRKYFKMDLHELLGIEMTTAGKEKEKIGDIPASVILLTREDIETAGYQNLHEILEAILGLYVSDTYLALKVGVRGFQSFYPNRNMIFLVNGIPQRDDYLSNYMLESFPVPMEAIDRIEVIRGPMSVVYGAGAFFGVVNIITNQPGKTDPPYMITTSLGSEKTRKLFARASGKSGDFQFVLNGSYFTTDGIDVPMEKMGGTAFLGLTMKDQLERRENFFNFSGTFKEFSVDLHYSETPKGVMLLLPPYGEGTKANFKNMRINIGYKKTFSDTFTLETKIGYFLNTLDFEYEWLFDDFYGNQKVLASSLNAELSLFIDPSPKLDITLGMYYINVLDVSLKFDIPRIGLNREHYKLAGGESMITRSVFAQLKYTFSDKLQMVAGIMVEQTPEYTMEERIGDNTLGITEVTQATYSQTEVVFIPRLALIYSLNERNIFKFLYGKAFDRPSFFLNRDLLTRPDIPPLQPETIQTFEVNYIGYPSSRLTLILSLFRNKLDNLIYETILLTSENTYDIFSTNVGEMVTNGMEFTLQWEPFKNLRLELSGTYLDTQDKRQGFEDIEVGDSPKYLGYFKASYFFNKNISLAVTGNYVDDMEAYYDISLSPPARLGERVDGYFVVGANLRIRDLFKSGMFVNLRFSNLLNEEIHYPTDTTSSLFAGKGTLGRGRSFLLTLGWKF
jgi:outer membrane receptor protein involved in Fe transport